MIRFFIINLVVFSLTVSCSSSSEFKNSKLESVSYMNHLKAENICESVRVHRVTVRKEEEQELISNWIADIKTFEKALDQTLKQKGALIKLFLWARERNLQPFPSALYLSREGYKSPESRLMLYKNLHSNFQQPSLFKHILQQEINSFSEKEGVGNYSTLISDYVGSLILSSRPDNASFVRWLEDSCSGI